MINIYNARYKYFKFCMIYVQNWRVRELLNILSQYKNQLTNRPHVISNQTNHLGENLGHLKDLEISKYKREWKGCMAIKFIVLFLLIVVVFGFLNIKCVTIYNENTFAHGNVLCKRIHSNLQILKNNQLDPYGSCWLFFRIYSWIVFPITELISYIWLLCSEN